jgi:elongator complex protein 5
MSLLAPASAQPADLGQAHLADVYAGLHDTLASIAATAEYQEDQEYQEWLAREIESDGAFEDRRPRKVKIRARDCKSWIKRDNRNFTGIRKRPRELPLPSPMNKPFSLAQYQRHTVHLLSRVLNVRTNASPFTLVLDDLNQRADLFLAEIARRALSRNVNVVIVTFESTNTVAPIRTVQGFGLTSDEIMDDLRKAMSDCKESLVLVDNLYELLNNKGIEMTRLFSLVANKFASTLVGVYHQDLLDAQPESPYAPQPLELVKYMATSIITCKSLAHCLAAKAAKERSLPEPTWGLLQGAEGIVQCLDANDHRSVVLEAEFRRKSGRPEGETYFLRAPRAADYHDPVPGIPTGTLKQEYVILLDQVPGYANETVVALVNAAGQDMESTFNLGLTDKQKQAREGVVLPYFDAQKGEGAGEGGRILYDMGSEDDFDEEEDEI